MKRQKCKRVPIACRYVDEHRTDSFARLNIAQCAFAGLYLTLTALKYTSSTTIIEQFSNHIGTGEFPVKEITDYCLHLCSLSQISSFHELATYLEHKLVTVKTSVNDVERPFEATRVEELLIAEEAGAPEIVTQHQPQVEDKVVKSTKRKVRKGTKTSHANNSQHLENMVRPTVDSDNDGESSHRQSGDEYRLACKAKRKHGQVDPNHSDGEHPPSRRSRVGEDMVEESIIRPLSGDLNTATRTSHERQIALPNEISGDPASRLILSAPAFPDSPKNYGMIRESAEATFPGTATFAPNIFWPEEPGSQDMYGPPSSLWYQN